MAEIFHEMVVNLPSVLDMLEESVALSIDPITALDNVVATVSTNNPSLEGGIDNIALQFAASHLIIAPLAVLFGGFGVDGWVMLCKRLVLNQSMKRWSMKAALYLKTKRLRYTEIQYELASMLQDFFVYLFKWMRYNDGNLHFCLLELSPPYTMNVVSSMVLLVMDIHHIHNHYIPTLLEHRLAELKAIYKSNKATFHNVVACSQVNIPMAMQRLFSLNLLNILPHD
ncbi:hypothetical protein EDC04DRAFT_2608039 [Pisolithus marmoratus]|nr:hypothetical protein EDC04DRAFT_2608039 [Pisolithus marmoratus]